MSDSLNEPNGHTNGNQSGQSQPGSGRGRSFFDDFSSAMHKGAEDARKAAEQAIPKVKAAAADAAYWAAYGVTFATVFEWTLLKQLTPECVKSGWHDGAKAGKETAEDWMQRMRQEKQASTASRETNEAGTANQSAQPGPA